MFNNPLNGNYSRFGMSLKNSYRRKYNKNIKTKHNSTNFIKPFKTNNNHSYVIKTKDYVNNIIKDTDKIIYPIKKSYPKPKIKGNYNYDKEAKIENFKNNIKNKKTKNINNSIYYINIKKKIKGSYNFLKESKRKELNPIINLNDNFYDCNLSNKYEKIKVPNFENYLNRKKLFKLLNNNKIKYDLENNKIKNTIDFSKIQSRKKKIINQNYSDMLLEINYEYNKKNNFFYKFQKNIDKYKKKELKLRNLSIDEILFKDCKRLEFIKNLNY